MKKTIVATLLAVAVTLTAQAEVARGTGVVKQVDVARSTVKLAHEPIPALKWPAMTMDFKVRSGVPTSDLKPGQSVEFVLDKGGDGYAISKIAPLAR